jgi:hypothetical protein
VLRAHVSDEGLVRLKNQKQLQGLNLMGTQVSDAGIEQFTGLKNLRQLVLLDTRVTDEGIAKLKRALPNAEISP